MVFFLSVGATIEYRGDAEAEIVESERMDRHRIVDEITEEIERLGIENIYVEETDEGVVIGIENIQFAADSAVLLASEKEKLNQIAQILLRYSSRDILVAGHTALAGSAESRMQLSQERAGAVANYFIERDIRTPERIIVRGYGAERPIADNDTNEGRMRNRRVEITILEN
jgi:outer membrane protein OmpA-like peptidoglycan-associated protein